MCDNQLQLPAGLEYGCMDIKVDERAGFSLHTLTSDPSVSGMVYKVGKGVIPTSHRLFRVNACKALSMTMISMVPIVI